MVSYSEMLIIRLEKQKFVFTGRTGVRAGGAKVRV
jgi:hypothetical protein